MNIAVYYKGSGKTMDYPEPEKGVLPEGWQYNGYESPMKGMPEWVDNVAFYSGPYDSRVKARKAITEQQKWYKDNGYITKFHLDGGTIIDMSAF